MHRCEDAKTHFQFYYIFFFFIHSYTADSQKLHNSPDFQKLSVQNVPKCWMCWFGACARKICSDTVCWLHTMHDCVYTKESKWVRVREWGKVCGVRVLRSFNQKKILMGNMLGSTVCHVYKVEHWPHNAANHRMLKNEHECDFSHNSCFYLFVSVSCSVRKRWKAIAITRQSAVNRILFFVSPFLHLSWHCFSPFRFTFRMPVLPGLWVLRPQYACAYRRTNFCLGAHKYDGYWERTAKAINFPGELKRYQVFPAQTTVWSCCSRVHVFPHNTPHTHTQRHTLDIFRFSPSSICACKCAKRARRTWEKKNVSSERTCVSYVFRISFFLLLVFVYFIRAIGHIGFWFRPNIV